MVSNSEATSSKVPITKFNNSKEVDIKPPKVFETHPLFLSKLTKIQQSRGQLKLRTSKLELQDYGADFEMIDLVDQPPPHSYDNLSPNRYDNERPVRLSKHKPKFPYASGQQPNLPFLDNTESDDNLINFEGPSQEEDFPSPSALFNTEDGSGFPFDSAMIDVAPICTNPSDRSEAAISTFDDSAEPSTPGPVISSSFENGVFDFSAFNDTSGEQDVFSSPLMQSSLKRPRPLTPEPQQVKCCRVKKGDTIGKAEQKSRSHAKPLKDQDTQQRSIPAWVDEFDQALIDELKGIVEFVD
jgi:ATP-dependent DNA helicase HFM1/MER3